MLHKKTLWYFILCILICTLPISCDLQKRVYLPGYFIQKRSSLPDRYFFPGNYTARHIPVNNVNDSTLIAFDPQSKSWLNYLHDKTIVEKEKNSLQVHIETKQLRNYRVNPVVPYNKVTAQPAEKEKNFNPDEIKRERNNEILLKNEEKGTISEPIKNSEYENLILAFLSATGAILLFYGIRKGVQKYSEPDNSTIPATKANGEANTKQEIMNIADRLDRCADRFANAKNERIELAARKTAIAINQCNNIETAKKIEKSFNEIYLSPSNSAALQDITLHNLLSNDVGYGGNGTLKPDVVTTTGGYYKNSAGSLSWTMGEPISETFSDNTNTLTQGFQQGSYSIVSVNEVDQSGINISVYPNPFTSILNIKSDTTDAISAQAVDLQGNIISTQSFETGQGSIDLSSLPEAIYLLRINDKDGKQLKVFKIQKVD